MSFWQDLKNEIVTVQTTETEDGPVKQTLIAGLPAQFHLKALKGVGTLGIAALAGMLYATHRDNIKTAVPQNAGFEALETIDASLAPARQTNEYSPILTNRPELNITNLYPSSLSGQVSISDLNCAFSNHAEIEDYRQEMQQAFATIDAHEETVSSRAGIQQCFWEANSHTSFLEFEKDIYLGAMKTLAQDPFVQERIEAWVNPRYYRNTQQAHEQHALKSELFQYMSDYVRSAFGLPPIPVILDNNDGVNIPDKYGGYYTTGKEEMGYILINLNSNKTYNFNTAFSIVLLEEIKHSIDIDLAALAIADALNENMSIAQEHGTLTAVAVAYDTALLPSNAGRTAEAINYHNYLSTFIERTAKELKPELSRAFFESYNDKSDKKANIARKPKI